MIKINVVNQASGMIMVQGCCSSFNEFLWESNQISINIITKNPENCINFRKINISNNEYIPKKR
jgi:hypothetical protein